MSKQDYTVTVKLSIYTLPLYPKIFSLNQKENHDGGYTLWRSLLEL